MPSIFDKYNLFQSNPYQSTAPINQSNPLGYSSTVPTDASTPYMQTPNTPGVDQQAIYNMWSNDNYQPGQTYFGEGTSSGVTGGTGGVATPSTSNLQQSIDSMAAAAKANAERVRNDRIAANVAKINSAYESLYGGLDTSETRARNTDAATRGILDTETANSQKKLDLARQQGLDTTAGQKTENELNTRSAMGKLGGLFAGAKQGLQNFLGARGLGDSSATDATGELLYRNYSGQMGDTLQTSQQNLAKIQEAEKNVEQFYQQGVGDLETQRLTGIQQAKLTLDNELARINGLRNTYGKSKEAEIQAAQADAWNNFQNEMFAIDSEANQQKFALDQWQAEQQQINSRAAQSISQASAPEIVPVRVDQAGNILSYKLYENGVPVSEEITAPVPAFGSGIGSDDESIWASLGLDTDMSNTTNTTATQGQTGGSNGFLANILNAGLPGAGELYKYLKNR